MDSWALFSDVIWGASVPQSGQRGNIKKWGLVEGSESFRALLERGIGTPTPRVMSLLSAHPGTLPFAQR